MYLDRNIRYVGKQMLNGCTSLFTVLWYYFNHYFEGLWVLTCILFELRFKTNTFGYQIEFNYELNC